MGPATDNQFTVLLVDCRLLRELEGVSKLPGVRFSVSVQTWYSRMAFLMLSARLDAAIMSPSSSPLAVGRSDMCCNSSLIPSRALRPGQRGELFAVDG
jgi:hypothetical protein